MRKMRLLLVILTAFWLCGCSVRGRGKIRLRETENQMIKEQPTENSMEETGELIEIEGTEETESTAAEEQSDDMESETVCEITPEGTKPVPEKHTETYVLLDMESILQNPELPTGCESVALTMTLNYAGFELDKTTIADDYLIFDDENFAAGYMGNPHSENGAGIFPPGLVDTADSFLVENNSMKRAFDLSGTAFSDLYNYVAEDIPVIVWNSMYMEEPMATDEICEYEGKVYQWFRNEHCVVFCGFDREAGTVFIQDPLEGLVERNAEEFEQYYDMIGQYAMIIH